MISEGSFKARGVAASMGKSSQKGTLCVSVTLRLEDGPHKGEMIDWVGWMSDATRARTAESLGWAWTYWQFDSDFILYNIDKDEWVRPIWKALVP